MLVRPRMEKWDSRNEEVGGIGKERKSSIALRGRVCGFLKRWLLGVIKDDVMNDEAINFCKRRRNCCHTLCA